MKYKNGKLLVVSAFLCFLLVLSVSSVVVQPAMSAGMWSEPLPTVDGHVSVDDKQRSSHIQLSDVDIYSHFGEAVGTCNFSLFLAGNGTHVYVGVNISNVPFLANLVIDWSGPEPQVLSGNATAVTVRFDNNGNGTLDLNEDRKQIMMFNDTFKMASDDYWDGSGYKRDVENGPGTGNITNFNITHSDMSAQGNIGNITMEMVFLNGTDPEHTDGGGIFEDNTTIAIDFMVMGLSGGMPTMLYQASTAGIGPEEDVSGFEMITGPIGNLAGDVTGFFNIYDGTITSTEAGNAEFVFDFDVTLYGPAGWTTDVDVYVANNGTHLYVGVMMEEVPYYANVTWSNPNGPPDPYIPQNVTFIIVKFDNDNNNTIDANEDAKQVILGNNTLTVGDDMFWNTTDDPDYSSDSGSDFPPDPGNMTAFAASHSNTAAQGNIGELTVELVMLLSSDPMGYDGGGLTNTVGFSVAYQAFVNIVFDPNGPPSSVDGEYFSEFSGMTEEDNNATLFWDLMIKDSNPAPEIDNPEDVSYEEGDTGYSITWTPTDTNPYKYNITKDGVVVEEGYWESGEEITINVDDLSVGNYTYVCNVNDTGGNSASDEVDVTVTAPEEVSEFSYGYAFIALITLPLIALIAYRKIRKLKV